MPYMTEHCHAFQEQRVRTSLWTALVPDEQALPVQASSSMLSFQPVTVHDTVCVMDKHAATWHSLGDVSL